MNWKIRSACLCKLWERLSRKARSIRTISAFKKSLVVEVIFTVPQTDTGGLVEYTKVDGRSMFRELGNKN